ncbi:MAG: type II CRISPR RNA-guided endonuclease Cas9 [Proteobacteria bacterium]|nr:type II CRISPR RNA-guided endonuclease Cas9 [Pseudomonadota bacterium]
MRIWGIDLGTTSIGFAIIEHDPNRAAGRIHRLGVRIFPEGVTEDKKEPRNKTRREKRLMRRSIRRRKLRRRLLNETLANVGLLPQYGTPEWNAVMAGNPYAFRRDGLSGKLEPHELGRALYHLAKRRGFAGRAVEQKKADAEEEAAKEDAKKLGSEIGNRTLGAFLAEQPKKRGRHHTRDMVKDEFDRLWARQKAHHLILSDAAFEARIRNLVFFQRPTFWRLSTLTKCQFCPEDGPEPKGSWTGQEFLVLEQLTKLRVAGANARPLSNEERTILLDLAHRQKTIGWNGIRKTLRKHWREREEAEDQTFNLEVSKAETGIKGNIVEFELRKVFGDAWDTHPKRDAIRRDVHRHLWIADYHQVGNSRVEIRRDEDVKAKRREARARMKQDWGLTDEQADALSKLELPGEWLGWSKTAVSEMLPLMVQGHSVGDLTRSPDWQAWREQTFPNRAQPTGEIRDRLPSHPRSMPEVRNPTIHRVLNELRKVTNNLLALYGKPDLIRIELTRELKESKSRRSDRLSRNKKQEGERKKALADLEAHGIANPGRDDIEKWLLWKESNERCPYTGDHIGFEALFREGKYQVEHIWPRSRSHDNTFANKTLCRIDVNIAKSNRTPFEMYAHDADAWHAVKQRLADCKLPEYKVRRFIKDMIADAGTDDFSDRQLADTGWAAREARDFLKRLWPDDGTISPVETVNGRLTAQLRHRWGLDKILNPDGWGKSRDDHRHHAVDAFAVALTSRSFVKRLSDWHRSYETTGARPPRFDAPWNGLFEESKGKIAKVVVSHRVQRKLSGPLHEERPLGLTHETPEKKGGLVLVRRKPLHELSDDEVESIRDDQIRKLVKTQTPTKAERKVLATKEFRITDRTDPSGRPVRKVRLLVERQPHAIKEIPPPAAQHGINPGRIHVELGQSLRHIALYRQPDGEVSFCTETRLQAVNHTRLHKSPVQRKLEDGSELLFSLCSGDILAHKNADGHVKYLVVRKVNQAGRVFYKPVTQADTPKPEVSFGPASFADGTLMKVSVDPIGRVRPARD